MQPVSLILADKIEYVSFDIFDTLVHRRLAAPVDLFSAVRNKLCESNLALHNSALLDEFPKSRIHAERQARKTRLKIHGGEAEITLDEIYEELQLHTKADIEVLQTLKATELELENLLLYRSPQGHELYEKAKKANKKIIYISDMYLSADFILKMMQRLGYGDCNEHSLFVSGQIRMSKYNGSLFDYVSKKLNISSEAWFHVGDNLHSDISKAKERGISTYHADWSEVQNTPQKCHGITDYLVSSVIKSLSGKHYTASEDITDPFVNQGYVVFGPLIFGFYLWLLNELKEYKPDKILFFARDSQLILKIHRFLLEEKTVDLPSAFEYTYLSRMALYELGFSDIDLGRFTHVLSGKTAGTVESVFKILGIDINQHTGMMDELGLASKTPIDESNRVHVQKLMSRLHYSILLSSSAQRKKFQEYFTNMIPDFAKIALVDIGWAGNIQGTYLRTLGAKWSQNEFQGFYLGTVDGAFRNRSPYSKLKGWLINEGNPKSKQSLLKRGGIELLEFALTADHGSTTGYTITQDNQVAPILEKKSPQEEEYERKAMLLQEGILLFVKDHSYLLKIFPLISLQSSLWQNPFFRLVKKPTTTQLKIFPDLTHSDSVGLNSKRRELAAKISLWHCIIKGKFYEDGLKNAFWKKAYCRLNSRMYRLNQISKFFKR